MFRAIPVSNKLCFDRDVKRSWKIHEEKLKKLKGAVGKQKPQKFQFLDSRLKKIALQDVRNIEIDRQNQALLSRIKSLENKCHKTQYSPMHEDVNECRKKTLNEPFRKRELIKIVEENQDMLKRLQGKRSQYNIKKMKKERRDVEKNISLISQYPYKHYPRSHTPVNMWATTDESRIVHKPLQSLEINLVFSGSKQFDQQKFNVRTYVSKGNFFLQLEGEINKKDKYRIELPQNKAKQLLQTCFQNSIQNLLNNLSIDREKQVCFLKYSEQKN